jgi:hypothetical protein
MRAAAAAALLPLLVACVPPPGARASPGYAAQVGAIHRVLLVTQVKAFEAEANNAVEEKQEWTATADQVVVKTISSYLSARGFAIQSIDSGPELQDELEDVRALGNAVRAAVARATYTERFPAKLGNFDYSVGPVSALLEKQHADALVMVYAAGVVPTTGNQIRAFAGLRSVPQQCWLAVELIASSGAVLWYDQAGLGGSDLNATGAVDKLARTIFTDFDAGRR